MAQVRWFCPVLMIPSLIGLFSAEAVSSTAKAVAYPKSVCNGDSVQLFDGIQIADSDTSATLYKNGNQPSILAKWTISGHNFTENTNLIMDDNKNIWIINVHSVDEGLYQIQYDMSNGTILEFKVQLSVLVAPNKNCNISVTEQGQYLTVALPDDLLSGKDCGKPRASVYWKNYTGVTVHKEKTLQLQSGKEAGTYFACMRGPALSCTKSPDPSADHCLPYNVNKGQSQSSTVGSTTQLSSDGSKDSIHIAIVVLQCVGLVLMPVLVISFWIYLVYKQNRCCCKRKSPNPGHQGKKDDPKADEKEQDTLIDITESSV